MSQWFNKYKAGIDDYDPSLVKFTIDKINDLTNPAPVLIIGPPGSGKTSFALNIVKHLGLEYFIYNSINNRNDKNINKIYQNIINIKRSKRIALIMDEIDGMTGNEKSGFNTLINYMQTCKYKTYVKHVVIICIVNIGVMKIKPLDKLKKTCTRAGHGSDDNCFISEPDDEQLKKLVIKIATNESIDIETKGIDLIVKIAQNDYRNLYNNFYMIYKIFIGKMKREKTNISILTEEFINSIAKFINKKDSDQHIMDNIKKLINTHDTRYTKIINIYNKDKSKSPMIIHENYLSIIDKQKCDETIKINNAKLIIKSIIKSDKLEKIMYLTQNWYLQYIQGLLSLYIPIMILNKYPKNNEVSIGWTKILSMQTILLNKKKKINSIFLIIKKINNYSTHDIQYLLEHILYLIINDRAEDAIKVLDNYHIYDRKIFEKIINIVFNDKLINIVGDLKKDKKLSLFEELNKQLNDKISLDGPEIINKTKKNVKKIIEEDTSVKPKTINKIKIIKPVASSVVATSVVATSIVAAPIVATSVVATSVVASSVVATTLIVDSAPIVRRSKTRAAK